MTATIAAKASLEEVVTALKQCLADSSGLRAPTDIDEHLPLVGGGLNLDSVAVVDLIGHVERRLGFQFHDADLRPRSFTNLSTLAQVILHRLENPDAAA
jgi:acyl carrier protein